MLITNILIDYSTFFLPIYPYPAYRGIGAYFISFFYFYKIS